LKREEGRVHLKLIAARAAAVVTLSCASIVITSLVGYADANPNNHGHHYGQLKHQNPAPPPAPTPTPGAAHPPAPRPNPPAVVPNVLQPNAVIAQTNVPPVSSGLTPPLPNLGGHTSPQRAGAAVPPFRDRNLWVIEALLPALLIVWLILLAASRVARKQKPAVKE
jgi:hypothetical protein